MVLSAVVMALREIRRNLMRSTLTALGIVIGVAAVIAMVSLGKSATQKITSDIAKLGNNLLIVSPGSSRRGPTAATAASLTSSDARAVTTVVGRDGVVAPTASRAALVVNASANANTIVDGSTNAFFRARGFAVARGRLFTETEAASASPVCVLGATVARALFHQRDGVGETVRVGRVACQVIGVLATKGSATIGGDQDDLIVMPILAVQHRLTGSTDISMIFVSTRDEGVTASVKARIEQLLRERRRIALGQADDFSVQDMREITNTLGAVTGALTALLGAIAGVSLLVGGIGIMNIMLVSVTERTREIGIRLAIGALASEVRTQFLVEAVVLTTLGGLIGLALGISGSYGVSRLLNLPFVIVPSIAVIAVVFSVAVGIVFGYVPARRAARLDPIEALRRD